MEHRITTEFCNFLKLERSLSANTVEAYRADVNRLLDWLYAAKIEYTDAKSEVLRSYAADLSLLEISERSQMRAISAIRTFYNFLLYNNAIKTNPAKRINSVKLPKHLPTTLSVEEIEAIIGACDLSKMEGQRNRAIIEVLYGSGIRVSELINLKLSNIYIDKLFMRVEGKGNKERLVPISENAISQINNWMILRNELKIKKGEENYLFLNRRGSRLTRVMIFTIVQNLAELAQIKTDVSPHTFRHSFATHLLEGGVNLRAIQQMLGHESILTTEIYTHTDISYLRQEILDKHPRNKK